ncbi:MAG: type I-E CRISPR-associated protein Cas6/Cse3/CasE [Armatimonadetes bacterium]|nr:type I-E CRISPR-associated protein Cas6/Cse3/CasE [Armatimonadota bacterium]
MNTALTLTRAAISIDRPAGDDRRATLPYLLHQAVADLFGDQADRGYLFRVLRQQPGRQVVLVLSRHAPEPLERLPRRHHWRALSIESKPFQPALEPGQELDFEIWLNATRCRRDEQQRQRRVDIWDAVWMADHDTLLTQHKVYHAYLAERLQGAAEVLEARLTERGEVRPRRAKGTAMPFIAANIAGRLRVTDPPALVDVMGSGIGRAKAFGCGLLCLSRPGTILARRPQSHGERALASQ